MRRLVIPLAALLVLPTVAAGAAPRCRDVAVDARRDTYAFPTGSSLYDEPGMDLTALNFRADAKTLTVVTSIADVDALMTTAPLGRGTWVLFDLSEASFLVALAQGVDASVAHLSVGEVDESVEHGGSGAGAWSGKHAAYLKFRVDAARNQIRWEVPIAELRKHTGGIGRGSAIRLRQVFTFDLEGTSQAHTGGSVDFIDQPKSWSWGAPSCA